MSAQVLTTGIVDMHFPDGAYNFAMAREGGIRAVIHKATEGRDFVDKGFGAAMERAKQAGLLEGAYHFANRSDPVTQAEHFLERTSSWPDALLALDIESNEDSSFGTMTLTQAMVFVQKVFDERGRWPLFYTFDAMLRRMMKTSTASEREVLAKCPLWIAKHGPEPKKIPTPWASWSLWQYSSSLSNGPRDKVTYPRGVPGFARASQDRSVFRGSEDELAVAWKTWGRT